jgi:uncharacterized membrane protein (DUF485 family)
MTKSRKTFLFLGMFALYPIVVGFAPSLLGFPIDMTKGYISSSDIPGLIILMVVAGLSTLAVNYVTKRFAAGNQDTENFSEHTFIEQELSGYTN